MSESSPSARTRVKHVAARGHYDRPTIDAILDEGLVCHIAFVDDGQPYAIPMNYARDHDRLLVHGAHESRLARVLSAGAPVCVTVSLVDGLVVGPSAAQYSMNYRSVVVLGAGREITDRAEKVGALRILVEHFIPTQGPAAERVPDKLIDLTAVHEIAIREASAKIRSGPASGGPGADNAQWSGEIPLRLAALKPVAAPNCRRPDATPAYIADYARRGLLRLLDVTA